MMVAVDPLDIQGREQGKQTNGMRHDPMMLATPPYPRGRVPKYKSLLGIACLGVQYDLESTQKGKIKGIGEGEGLKKKEDGHEKMT